MKVAVVGKGHVGTMVFRELQAFREIHELVLVGREKSADACRAEVEDYMDAIPLRIDKPGFMWGGGYELAKDADIIVYCAGPSIKNSEDRMSIAEENVDVVKSVFAELDKYAPDAIVVAVSNPLDVIVTAIKKYTNRPAGKVIGTGTLLDTARMHKLVSWAFKVPPQNVSGYVLGEHGASSVVLMSTINIMGVHYSDYLELECNGIIPINSDGLNKDVRNEGLKIFRGKGYTSAGVAAAAARIVFDIVNDTKEIIPVSTVLNGEYGVTGYAMSVPCQIGQNGIESVKKIVMSEEEAKNLKASAEAIGIVCEKLNLIQNTNHPGIRN